MCLVFLLKCCFIPNVESKVHFEWLTSVKWHFNLLPFTWFWGCGCEKFNLNLAVMMSFGADEWFRLFWKLFLLCFADFVKDTFCLVGLCYLWICVRVNLPTQEHCHSTDSLLYNAFDGLAMFFPFFHTLICKDKVLYFFTNKDLHGCKRNLTVWSVHFYVSLDFRWKFKKLLRVCLRCTSWKEQK